MGKFTSETARQARAKQLKNTLKVLEKAREIKIPERFYGLSLEEAREKYQKKLDYAIRGYELKQWIKSLILATITGILIGLALIYLI